jgi:hypothetical protein
VTIATDRVVELDGGERPFGADRDAISRWLNSSRVRVQVHLFSVYRNASTTNVNAGEARRLA